MKKIRMFLVCSGLGSINRGFESFTEECFCVLNDIDELDVTLFKGGQQSLPQAIRLWNLPRNSTAANFLGKLTRKESYFIEQVSFAATLLPYIWYKKPDIIYFSDGTVGNVLWHWRQLTGQRYGLLFSNGGQLRPPYLARHDYIQQITPYFFDIAMEGGVSVDKQMMVPYGINMLPQLKLLSDYEKAKVRCDLDLPKDSSIVLSVGAINQQKRMEYVIHEVACLPEPRPFLLLLGQLEKESDAIIQLGNKLLGPEHFKCRSVPSSDMSLYYKSADIFVLASLSEGFGRVFLEAMSYGVPCIAHDYDVARFVLGEDGYYADLRKSGNLAALIQQVLAENSSLSNYHNSYIRRHYNTYRRFSWEVLRTDYVKLVHHCLTLVESSQFSTDSVVSN